MPTPAQAGDSAARLTRAIARGDHAALDEFYRAWQPYCLAVARRAARGDESRAWDILHDAMLRVAGGVRELPSDDDLRRYLARTVYTAALDSLRAQRRRLARERDWRSGDRLRKGTPDADLVSWLEAELDRLPEPDRGLVRLRIAAGMSLEQVGRALGMSADAVHGRVRRLLAVLRRRAGKDHHDR